MVNSITFVKKKSSFNSSKIFKPRALFFVDNSKSPPRSILELFLISFSILFFKIVTDENINKLMKIVKKTPVITDLFLFKSFTNNWMYL